MWILLMLIFSVIEVKIFILMMILILILIITVISLLARIAYLAARSLSIWSLAVEDVCADIILWRNKEKSACILAGATVIWLLFEKIDYHLLTFVCHFLLLVLVPLFLWFTVASFTHISPPEVPEIIIPRDLFVAIALQMRIEYIGALRILGDASFGTDTKKFFKVIVALWGLSVLGSWFNFLTLFYLATVIVLVVPVLYEKYEDTVDTFAEKALVKLKIQYKLLNEKVLQEIPKAIMSYKNKKQH
ncbi:hypothetical protein FEM48_Zijuj02G0120100 [Ziziphus jujuba var. spinosa]|uniref:Reticulon-like protein n=1 Tax=Ziziphus jujuba var. spinosa TaxID=714518 RepID=A0A978VVL5_ZIZJJ|nr:hypothetical protein FEM48_Zijuj02G0120100 [Ziziphus jujuba var. spinosa]